jgi:hypothetical protein
MTMNNSSRFTFYVLRLLLLVVLLVPATATVTQGAIEPGQAGEYDLSWWTVDGGGVTSSDSSGYSLGGTAGQPDAAVWSGGDYVLAGGFWGGVAVEFRIYLPLVLRST